MVSKFNAAMAKQVDARDLKSLGKLYSRAGSIPARGTIAAYYLLTRS